MFNVQIGDKTLSLEKETALKELNNDRKYIGAKVNNRLRELTFELDRDCCVEFLDLSDNDACRMYEATLRYVFLMALRNILPHVKASFSYSISRSLFIEIDDIKENIDEKLAKKIHIEMKRIIDLDLPIVRKEVSVNDIMKYYDMMEYYDKKEILKYRLDNIVHMYFCGDYINYMFGYMLPSTGYLADYKLFPYYPGLILQYPRSDLNGCLPEFKDAPKFSKHIRDSRLWAEMIGADSISNVNKKIEENKTIDLINICETRHNRMLNEIGQEIYNNKENIRLIAIAGPSSSGKTTFSNRLRIELLSRGITPVKISIDDYYLPKSMAPIDIDGKPDLEHIEALDIERFNHDMLALIQGEEVVLPRFDFKTGKTLKGEKMKLQQNEPLIIEGIHALNERLTSLIQRHQKYKIYIAPQQQMKIDNHNPIRITDIRLLRRIVRDKNTRNTEASKTLEMWASVRRGEFNWIYDNQEDADYIFNSELAYEFGVLKKHALPMLKKIKRDDEYFVTANRLVKFLKYFKDIPDDYLPCNSLLREFIGGSCFKL